VAGVVERRVREPATRSAAQPVPRPAGHDVGPAVAVDVGHSSAHGALRVDQGGRPFRRRRGRAVQPDDLIGELIVTYGVDVAVAVEVTEGEVVTVARARDEVLGPPARRGTEPDRLP